MKIDPFMVDRVQSLHEQKARFNISMSGVSSLTLADLLSSDEMEELQKLPLGYGDTKGSAALRGAVAACYANQSSENVLVTNGVSEANFLAVWSLLMPGDEIVVLTPTYLQILGIAESFGVRVVRCPLDADANWALDFDQLRDCMTGNTRLISLFHPNNPTGSAFDQTTMLDLIAFARTRGVRLHVDEVYRNLSFKGPPAPSFAELDSNAIVTDGLSKSYGLPGLRLGWTIADQKTVDQLWQTRAYTSITNSQLADFVAQRALQPARRGALLQRNNDIIRQNLLQLNQWAEHHRELLTIEQPDHGGMTIARYTAPMNSVSLFQTMLNTYHTLMVPGAFYGLEWCFRVGLGTSFEHLHPGLDRVVTALANLHAGDGKA